MNPLRRLDTAWRAFLAARPPEMTERELESALILAMCALIGFVTVAVAVLAQWIGGGR